MSDWVLVAKVAEFFADEPKLVDIDGALIAVFRLEDGFYAMEDVCTHDGGQLTGGCIKNGEITCPRHGARFSIRTGEALCSPAFEPAAVFPVKIDNNAVFVRDDRWD